MNLTNAPSHGTLVEMRTIAHGPKTTGDAMRDTTGRTGSKPRNSKELKDVAPIATSESGIAGEELRRPSGAGGIHKSSGFQGGSTGAGRARIDRVTKIGPTYRGMKQWRVQYTGGLPEAALWVPEALGEELFLDFMRDIAQMDLQ